MVKVKNVLLEGEILSFEYYPEGESDGGYFKTDLTTETIIEWRKAHKHSSIKYLTHALHRIEQYIKNGEIIPIEFIVAWY